MRVRSCSSSTRSVSACFLIWANSTSKITPLNACPCLSVLVSACFLTWAKIFIGPTQPSLFPRVSLDSACFACFRLFPRECACFRHSSWCLLVCDCFCLFPMMIYHSACFGAQIACFRLFCVFVHCFRLLSRVLLVFA